MTINSEQIQALKAAAESCGKQEPLSLVVYHGKMCLRNKGGIVFTVIRDICFPEYSAENENYARLAELCTPDSILSLLAERAADKALIGVYSDAYKEAAHAEAVNWEAAASLAEENVELKRRIAELEARTLTVKLPDYSEFAIVHFTGCSDDYAKGWVDGKNTVANAYATACAAAGITLVVGE
ncbi:hypothetical protein DFO55_101724 [Grimontella sp. AG753]|nr:hypothetical protein DFO55_101724 [Grimontella sp. AG753]